MEKKLEVGILSVVNQTARILSKSLSFEDGAEEFLKILYSFWDVPHSYVALYNREAKILRIVKSFGLSKEEVEKGVFKKGEGIIGKVYKSGIPVVLSDIHISYYLNKTGLRDRLSGRETFVAVPIKVGEEIVGVLAFFKDFKKESVEEGVKLALILATMLGMLYKLSQRMEQEKREWEEEKRMLTEALSENFRIEGIIGVSPAIRQLGELIRKVAHTDITVLITGESGTGKSLIAKAIHYASPRKDKPLITVNCSAIPESLLEAELFGYEKGAFTGAYSSRRGKFELANGGSIFLDEIGDLPLSLQPKLLRVIQDKEIEKLGGEKTIKVDVRIISATNKDLKEMVEKGEFREDLFYRISVFPIHVPPLRERKEDIPLLVEHFLKVFNQRYKKNVRLSQRVLEVLMDYPWYGNVRELENFMERLVILKDGLISEKDLPTYLFLELGKDKPKNLPSFIEATEKEEIIRALEKTGYVKSRAAKLLGLTLRQLDYRIRKYNIEVKRF